MNNSTKILLVLAVGWMATTIQAQTPQDRIHYTGKELSNPTYHDGQLSPVVGVHNIQLVRANREHPEASNGMDGLTTISLCWLTGTVSFIISIWQIRQMNMYHLPKRSS